MPAKSKRKAPLKKLAPARSGAPNKPVPSRPILPASYGVKTTSKTLLDWDWARQRLIRSQNYVVVTVYPDGRPHAMGMHGLWWEDAFYFGTGDKTRKAKNLAQNPRCIILSDRLEELVIVEGLAETISFADLPKGLSEQSRKKYGWPMHEGRDSSIYKVRPAKVFGIPLKQFGMSFTRWIFA